MRTIGFTMERIDGIVDAVIDEFNDGRPLILPTDTLYGLAAPVSDENAIRRIFDIKERPRNRSLPVAVADLKQLEEIAVIPSWARPVLERNLPGPVTFVMKAKGALPDMVTMDGTVAVRVPKHPLFPRSCRMAGPLALTSANVHRADPIITPKQARSQFFNLDILMVIDDRSISGSASTMVDLSGEWPRIVREGKVKMDEVMGETNGRR